jgi:hypothetical protein
VERDQQRARREGGEERPRDPASQRPRRGKERERGREGGKAEQPRAVAESFGESGERLLEQVEAGRARVAAQRLEEIRQRETRGPEGEDLVEPRGPLEEKPQARRERDRREKNESPRAQERRPASDFGFDALS